MVIKQQLQVTNFAANLGGAKLLANIEWYN